MFQRGLSQGCAMSIGVFVVKKWIMHVSLTSIAVIIKNSSFRLSPFPFSHTFRCECEEWVEWVDGFFTLTILLTNSQSWSARANCSMRAMNWVFLKSCFSFFRCCWWWCFCSYYCCSCNCFSYLSKSKTLSFPPVVNRDSARLFVALEESTARTTENQYFWPCWFNWIAFIQDLRERFNLSKMNLT